jgi:hypothetical protein
MITTNNSPEVKEASAKFFAHVEACTQCKEAFDNDYPEDLCKEGDAAYEAEHAAMRKTGVEIRLVKQEDSNWVASFSDRHGGGFGSTPQEALCNLADIIEECMNK